MVYETGGRFFVRHSVLDIQWTVVYNIFQNNFNDLRKKNSEK